MASRTAYCCPMAGTRVSLFGPCVSSVDTDTQGCETAVGAVIKSPGGRENGFGVESKPCPSIIGVTVSSQFRLAKFFA
jgi:hypothetical protein